MGLPYNSNKVSSKYIIKEEGDVRKGFLKKYSKLKKVRRLRVFKSCFFLSHATLSFPKFCAAVSGRRILYTGNVSQNVCVCESNITSQNGALIEEI